MCLQDRNLVDYEKSGIDHEEASEKNKIAARVHYEVFVTNTK